MSDNTGGGRIVQKFVLHLCGGLPYLCDALKNFFLFLFSVTISCVFFKVKKINS